ncbi:MAG: TetR/AcrR family transcriptional regulator [Candidatus Sumerlaeota bacterium]
MANHMPHTTQNEAESEKAIRASAMVLFASKGYNGTSVREIVEAAGVTKPTLYYYFENKETLYRRLIVETTDKVKADLLAAVSRAHRLRDALLAVATTHFRWLKSEPLLSAALFRAVFGAAPDQRHFDVLEHARFEEALLMDILKQAAERDEIPHEFVSEETVRMYFAGIHIYIVRQAVGMKDDLSDALAEDIVDFFLGGLRYQMHSEDFEKGEEV